MRDLLFGYYQPSSDEYVKLWQDATFVLDTNVLLNLYSYPESVREVFLSVLQKVASRIWVPYQVALEFERNRIPRIKQANQRVEKLLGTIQKNQEEINSEVVSIELEKRNLGVADLVGRVDAVKDAHERLSEAVQLAIDKLPSISLEDPIRDRLAALLQGHIGTAPKNQEDLDALTKDGPDRYAKRIPPGFADADKGTDTYQDRCFTYERRFGDLILWKQLLSYAKDKKLRSVVLVTGDRKDDWWWRDSGKTLGPLPELVQELRLVGGVSLFWMYTADQFLSNAEKYLQAKEVTREAVDRVKEIASEYRTQLAASRAEIAFSEANEPVLAPLARVTEALYQRRIFEGNSTELIAKWLAAQYPGSVVHPTKDFPDLVVRNADQADGFEIKRLSNFRNLLFPPGVVNSLLRGYWEVSEERLTSFTLILILSQEDSASYLEEGWEPEATRRIQNLLRRYPARSIVVGSVATDRFQPLLVVKGDK